ncbi:MAG: hypothetical protein M1147_07605 [Nitrospirae bacterium]|nr:hypothetical protein [Nitrospirota bacterium]MCL5977976.1 hypothetical protein [Nitrospirota bacterium]
MNRIYQGRVTGVETFENGVWTELQDWKTVLWQHHELFQDAVNYYLAAFAALVPVDCDENLWIDYREAIIRSWVRYTGRQGTWTKPFSSACHVCGCDEDASFNEFRLALLRLTVSKASEEQRFAALKQLFESAIQAVQKLTDPDQPIEDSLKGKGKDLFGSTLVALCAQKTKLTPRNIKAEQRNKAVEVVKGVEQGSILEWKDVFAFKTDKSETVWPRDEASGEIVQALDDVVTEIEKRAKKAKNDDQQRRLITLSKRLAAQRESLATWCKDPDSKIPISKPTRKGSGGYDLKAAILYSLRPDVDGFRETFLFFNQSKLKDSAVGSKK